MQNLGDRINEFDNSLTKTVGRFNMIFKECPIFGFKDEDSVEIGEITKATYYRLLQIEEFEVEHNFQRLLKSETTTEIKDEEDTITDATNTDNDPWLWMFV